MRAKPAGSMLIELVLLMTGGSAVLLTAVMVMHRCFEMTDNFQSIAETQATLQRLSADFRGDVFRACEVHHDSSRSIRMMQTDETVITYELKSNTLVRTEKSVQGDSRIENYRLPEAAAVQWHSEPLDAITTRRVSEDSTITTRRVSEEPQDPSATRMIRLQVKRPVTPQLVEMRLELSVAAFFQDRRMLEQAKSTKRSASANDSSSKEQP